MSIRWLENTLERPLHVDRKVDSSIDICGPVVLKEG